MRSFCTCSAEEQGSGRVEGGLYVDFRSRGELGQTQRVFSSRWRYTALFPLGLRHDEVAIRLFVHFSNHANAEFWYPGWESNRLPVLKAQKLLILRNAKNAKTA